MTVNGLHRSDCTECRPLGVLCALAVLAGIVFLSKWMDPDQSVLADRRRCQRRSPVSLAVTTGGLPILLLLTAWADVTQILEEVAVMVQRPLALL